MAICFVVAAILAKPDIGRMFEEMFSSQTTNKFSRIFLKSPISPQTLILCGLWDFFYVFHFLKSAQTNSKNTVLT